MTRPAVCWGCGSPRRSAALPIVPRVMQSMFEWLAPRLQGGARIESRSAYTLGLGEGLIAAGLTEIQGRYPDIALGSYPFNRPSGNGVTLVANGTSGADAERCRSASAAVRTG